MSDIKKTLYGIKDRLDTEEKIHELENIATKNIQSKTQTEKNTLKMDSIFELRDNFKQLSICVIRTPKEGNGDRRKDLRK